MYPGTLSVVSCHACHVIGEEQLGDDSRLDVVTNRAAAGAASLCTFIQPGVGRLARVSVLFHGLPCQDEVR